jgi:lipoprotein-anchoring transpeptidase ErfK/SrfK
MQRLLLTTLLFGLLAGPCEAQWLFGQSWDDDDDRRSYRSYRAPGKDRSSERRADRKEADGGPRPQIRAQAPPIVDFAYGYPEASIVIDTSGRKLYYVLPAARAYSYSISVGREGFNWTGTEKISRKQEWPDWYPPKEMRERDPKLPEKMTGGVRNPLGAMALYLGTTLYRIHGTNDVKSLGQAQSSGCFRMMNSAVLHLASLAEVGTIVTVVATLPTPVEVSKAETSAASPSKALPEARASLRDGDAGQDDRESPEYRDRVENRELRDYRDLRDYTFGRRP